MDLSQYRKALKFIDSNVAKPRVNDVRGPIADAVNVSNEDIDMFQLTGLMLGIGNKEYDSEGNLKTATEPPVNNQWATIPNPWYSDSFIAPNQMNVFPSVLMMGVAQEPIPAGGIGKVLYRGITWLKITDIDVMHHLYYSNTGTLSYLTVVWPRHIRKTPVRDSAIELNDHADDRWIFPDDGMVIVTLNDTCPDLKYGNAFTYYFSSPSYNYVKR